MSKADIRWIQRLTTLSGAFAQLSKGAALAGSGILLS